jgi:hypothetical protein
MNSRNAGRAAPMGGLVRVPFRADLSAPAADVWALIGPFDSLARWHPLVAECGLEREPGTGAIIRRILIYDGTVIRNRLLGHDDAKYRYSYDLVEGPLTVKSYRSTLQVLERGARRSTLDWVSEFDPGGASEAETRSRVEGLIGPGIESLKRIFGAQRS